MTSHKPSTTPKAVIAIVAATIGLAALTPSAFAAGPDRGGNDGRRDVQQHRQGGDRMGADRGGFIGLTCGPKAAERIEHAMVSLSYRVNPTGEQVQLLDALKTAALDAQKDFSATCDATLPVKPVASADGAAPAAADAPKPNMLEMMEARLKLEEARVAALGDVLPSFEAFFNSLSDEQKATLELRGHDRGDRGPGHDGQRDGGRRGPGQDRNG